MALLSFSVHIATLYTFCAAVPAHEQFGQTVYATCTVTDGKVRGMDVDGLLRDAKAAGIDVEEFEAGHVRSAILAVVAARLYTI